MLLDSLIDRDNGFFNRRFDLIPRIVAGRCRQDGHHNCFGTTAPHQVLLLYMDIVGKLRFNRGRCDKFTLNRFKAILNATGDI